MDCIIKKFYSINSEVPSEKFTELKFNSITLLYVENPVSPFSHVKTVFDHCLRYLAQFYIPHRLHSYVDTTYPSIFHRFQEKHFAS